MTEQALRKTVKRLSEKFGVTQPDTRIGGPYGSLYQAVSARGAVTNTRVSRQDGRVAGMTIILGRAAGEDAARHEFAHVLDTYRHGATPATDGGKGVETHNRRFYETLIEVLQADADPRTHDWQREYPHLRAWAIADGWWDGEGGAA